MIYFESLKLKNNNFNQEYGLSLKIEKGVHYFTSNSKKNLDSIYNYIRFRNDYLDGSLFIDNINISKLDANNFINFCYENISFCEDSLIVDQHISTYKLIEIFYSFDNKHIEYNLKQLLQIFDFDDNILHKKIKWLNEFDKWKFKLLLATIKPSKYLVIEPINYDFFRENVALEMKEILNAISEKLNKIVLVFQEYNNLLVDNIIDLNNKSNFQRNKRLTLTNNLRFFSGFNLIKNHFNIYKIALKSLWPLWLSFAVFSLIFTTVFIFMLSLYGTNKNSNPSYEWLVDFAHKEGSLWLFGAYAIYSLNIILLTCVSLLVYFKTKNYLKFLNAFGVRNNLISLVIPLLILLMILLITILGFLINVLIFELKLEIHENDTWWASFYASVAYFLYAFVISCIFIFASNKKINFKLLIQKVINKNIT